jgi:hypothetical protein
MRYARLMVIGLLAASRGQAQQTPEPLRVAASSFASVEVHLNSRMIGGKWYAEDAGLTGPARVTITYGQPHARGRQIVGGLIPNDAPWRFGANEATTLATDVDLTLGGTTVAQGTYTLYLLHSKDAWQLLVNSSTRQWGTDYDASKTIARIPLTARTTAESEDALTIYLDPESANPRSGYAALAGALRIRWGTVELKTSWTIRAGAG